MIHTFKEWFKKMDAAGGISIALSPAPTPPAPVTPSPPPMDASPSHSDDCHNPDHHGGIGVWPWWGYGTTTKRKSCKYGKRKDGKCRKKPKK